LAFTSFVSRERFRSLGARLAVSGAGDLGMPSSTVSPGRGRQTSQATLRLLTVLVIAIFVIALVTVEVLVRFSFAWDFRALYQAGHDYLHLHSPYVSGALAQLTSRENFVYPLPIAAIFAPVSLFPYHLAAALFVALSAACLALTLRILGVRDWRCYAAALIGMPAVEGTVLGTMSPMLALLLALLWRFRDRSRIAVPVVVLLVLAKLFLWPALLWLLVTRRFRTAALAVGACATSVLVFSLPVGLGTLTHYPSLLRSLSSFESSMSLSLLSLGEGLSGSYFVGLAAAVVAGSALLYGMARSASRGDELRAFSLSIVAALAMSPIVWNHYLVILFVPLALTRPRFSVLWLASAWIMDDGGAGLDRRAIVIVAVAAWLVTLAQAGVFSRSSSMLTRRRAQVLEGSLSLGGAVICVIALGWIVLTIIGEVPAVAALTPPGHAGPASGTALLRFSRESNRVCWNILTSGIPPHARAEITDRGKVIAQKSIRSGRSDACTTYAGPGQGKLAAAFAVGRVHPVLTILTPGGADLLRGNVLRKPPSLATK
jgi:glycosyl transferase family 87